MIKEHSAVLSKSLIKSGISERAARQIVRGAEIGIVNKGYLVELGLSGNKLSAAIRFVKNFYFDFSNADRIANTNNYFHCDDNYVYFNGMDIDSKRIKINKQIAKIMKTYGYEKDGDLIELYDEDSINFFKSVYLKYGK